MIFKSLFPLSAKDRYELRFFCNSLGPQGVALVETLKVIGEKGVRITPDVLASGGNGDGAGNLATLLLLNLFRDQMKVGQNGSIANGQTGVSAKQW